MIGSSSMKKWCERIDEPLLIVSPNIDFDCTVANMNKGRLVPPCREKAPFFFPVINKWNLTVVTLWDTQWIHCSDTAVCLVRYNGVISGGTVHLESGRMIVALKMDLLQLLLKLTYEMLSQFPKVNLLLNITGFFIRVCQTYFICKRIFWFVSRTWPLFFEIV